MNGTFSLAPDTILWLAQVDNKDDNSATQILAPTVFQILAGKLLCKDDDEASTAVCKLRKNGQQF